MKSSEFRHITDELLSAYLDNAVSDQERALVEAAVSAEPDIAWRLDSLRQTVHLLKALPELALPRSFVLQEAQLGEARATRGLAARPASPAASSAASEFWADFVANWRALWQAGNPVLRNAAAASFALLLVLLAGAALLTTQPQPASVQVASAPAAGEAQPAGQPAVALASPAVTRGSVETLPVAQAESAAAPAEPPLANSAPATAESASDASASDEPAAEPAAKAPPTQDQAAQGPSAEQPAPEMAAALSAPAPAQESIQQAAPQGAEPLLTPVAPLPNGAALAVPGGRAMGGGGDGMGAGGAGGAGGDMPAYPGSVAGGGLLPPQAYESGPDFVPAEPAGASAAQPSPTPTPVPTPEPTPTAEAVALLPVEPSPAPGEESGAEAPAPVVPETPTAGRVSYGVQVTGAGLLRMAQVGVGLITLMLLSLWWRSRSESTDR